MKEQFIRCGTVAGTLYMDRELGEGFVVINEEARNYFFNHSLNVKDTLTDMIEGLVREANEALEVLGEEERIEWGYYKASEEESE